VHLAGGDDVGLDHGQGVAQANPTAIGAPDITRHPARLEVHLGRAVGLEIEPANVRAVSITAQVAQAILVDPKIIGRKVLIIDAIGGSTAAQADPARVGRVDGTRADVLAN